MDMIGNLWEWCSTIWGTESTDLNGYNYRTFRGGAWNISDPDYLRATDRGEGHTPRGSLNDCGFRLVLDYK
jgi:formylglycine-generating enzyme required for sulfatase activity